jgi:hypothetical protein
MNMNESILTSEKDKDKEVKDKTITEKEPISDEPQEKEPISIEPQEKEPISDEPQKKEPISDEPQKKEPISIEPQEKEPISDETQEKQPISDEPQEKTPITKDTDEEETLIPIFPAIKQFFKKDIFGSTVNISTYLMNQFEDEVDSVKQLFSINNYIGKVGEIFKFLPLLIDFLPEDKIADIAISILVDDKVTEDVSKILSQNLAKGANIFLEEFNETTKEKQDELIQMIKQMTDEAVSSIGSGIATGLTNAVSDIPPVGAIMAIISLIRGLLDSADRVLKKAEIAEDTVTDIINKTTQTYNKKWDDSGGPELVELAKLINQLSKLNPEQITNEALRSAQEKTSEKISSKLTQVADDSLSKITPSIQIGGRSNKKSILKTKKHKNYKNKKTKKVRFII